MTCIIFLSFIALVSVHCSVEFCLNILSIYLSTYNTLASQPPSIIYPYPFPTTLYCSTVFRVFHCVLFIYLYGLFHIIHSILFISFFPSPLVSSNSSTFENIFCIYLSMYLSSYLYIEI
jgi:hypothetical protein